MRKIYGSFIQLRVFCACLLTMFSLHATAKCLESDSAVENGLYTSPVHGSGFFSDSTFLQKASRDLDVLKKHIEVSSEQELDISKIFKNKYHFLQTLHISQERRQLTLRAMRREFEIVVNELQLQILNKAELVDFWFKLD